MPTVATSGDGTHLARPKNNAGTVLGNFTATSIIKGIGVNTLADDFGKSFGSAPKERSKTLSTEDKAGVTKAFSAGEFAHEQSSTEWLHLGNNVTSLAGATNRAIASAGANWDGKEKDSIHQTVSTRQVGSGDLASFDFYAKPDGTMSPNYTRPANAGYKTTFVQADGTTAATDDAATPTRSVPGELTFRQGGALPVNADYKARDTFES